MKEFHVNCEERNGIQLVFLKGSLDMYSFPQLEHQLQNLFQAGQHRIVLDCAGLEYIGSAGLGGLIGIVKQAREHGGDLRLLRVPDRIYKIIELLGFTKVLLVFADEAAALNSFDSR